MARPLAGGRADPGAADRSPRSRTAPPTLETEVVTASAAETMALGRRLARVSRAGDLICLWGELGAGKTQLAKGFALGLGIEATITSPTFILMAEYPGRLPLFHVDLFRLADAADALAGGVIDDRQADGVTLVEWPDRMGDVLPAARLDIRIDGSADQPRTIRIVATDSTYRRFVGAASA
jgi:tRNA threonylcarbamoyladenosine biosynthesis protein TsaE